LKPSSLSRMMVPLCRMVAMPIVRPTLSSDLASLEADFVHGYREWAVVFYLSTTNEGGVVEKMTDEDLQSWCPLWCAVNTRFEDYLSSVPELRYLKGVKFSVCDGNHHNTIQYLFHNFVQTILDLIIDRVNFYILNQQCH
jgi:hypothetical protein